MKDRVDVVLSRRVLLLDVELAADGLRERGAVVEDLPEPGMLTQKKRLALLVSLASVW